jgi:hypothetical protein
MTAHLEGYEAELNVTFQICSCAGKRAPRACLRGLDYLSFFFGSSVRGESPCFPRVREQLKGCPGAVFDVVARDFLDAAVNFPKKITIPTVQFQHNVESEICGDTRWCKPIPQKLYTR